MGILETLHMKAKPAFTAATAVYGFDAELEERFQFTSRFGDVVSLSVNEGGKFLHLPRELCPLGYVDKRAEGEFVHFAKCPEPRDHQTQVFLDTIAFLKEGKSGVVCAYTGFGKTLVGFVAAYAIRRKTLVITTKDDIAKQWIEGATKFLGVPPERVGVIRGDKCEVLDTDFCVAMIQSLSKDEKYPDWITESFGLVIFDECFHPSTQLLTRSGWKPVAEIVEGEEVMAFDAEKGVARFEATLRTVTKPFVGNLVRCANGKFDTLTTPGHEQPIRLSRKGVQTLGRTTMGALAPGNGLQLPVAAPLETEGSGLTAWDRLRIAFEADGHHLYTGKRDKLHTYRFAFRRERKVKRLAEILETCGVEFKQVTNARGDVCMTFKHQALLTKDFSWFDPFASRIANEEFLAELVLWDGWANDEGSFWEHGSRDRADQIQLIAELTGRQCSVNRYERWRVRWFDAKTWVETNVEKTSVPYVGPVHCVTVPSGNVFTRLGAIVSISGNCHRVPADQFSRVACMFPAKLRLGLSATPKRADGKEIVVTAHIGPVRVQTEIQLMVPKVQRFQSGWKVPRRADAKGDYVMIPHEAGKMGHIEKIIASDPDRNELLGKLIAMCHEKGRKIAVFSTLHDHLKAIRRVCTKKHGISGKDIGEYVGATTKAEKEHREREKLKPILLTTYMMMGEGTDIDWLDTAIIAMPRGNVVQPVGRIRRENAEKKFPVVMDVLDDDSPVFKNYGKARLKWYKSIGCEIKDYV